MFFALHLLNYKDNLLQNKYLYKQSVSCATSTSVLRWLAIHQDDSSNNLNLVDKQQ